MKWLVRHVSTPAAATSFGSTSTTSVEADYHRVEGGVLTFRNRSQGDSFPEPVRVFAPGYWLDVLAVPKAEEKPKPAPEAAGDYEHTQKFGYGNVKYDVDLLRCALSHLNLNIRAKHALINANIPTIGQLVQCSERDLLGISNIGKTTLQHIKEQLAYRGLLLRRDT